MTSVEVRQELVRALELDLTGPSDTNGGDANEVLPQSPSRWYLTGFLAPLEGSKEQRTSEDAHEELDLAGQPAGLDDSSTPEASAARQRYLPSSIGASVIVPESARELQVAVTWGDYHRTSAKPELWERTPRSGAVVIDLLQTTEKAIEEEVAGSNGLRVAFLARGVGAAARENGLPANARTVSVFVVNYRTPAADSKRDEAFAFQVRLSLAGCEFLARPNLRGLETEDWDEAVADLQYRDTCEYAVGHNVATETVPGGVRTCWIPQAQVERVAPGTTDNVELSMDALSKLASGAEAELKLLPLVAQYRAWIAAQTLPSKPKRRAGTARELMERAEVAAKRIESGIKLLADPQCLEAFRIANGAMERSLERRGLKTREWFPFQLAFILMNLPGIAHPEDADREVVDLLFFPTGGGKTEAYLGLAAFTLVLRRLRNPGIASAGLSVLMRYTLRLLTLDQLGRAATLICALELERQKDVTRLGEWPFEIGLWVGRGATPNQMGKKGDKSRETARSRTIAFLNDDRKPSPIPLEECPWCGEKFRSGSFKLIGPPDNPTDLRINCVKRGCEFSRSNPLPIVAVDEPIYRRLPSFLIATVDKFAALPWTGEVGAFFGRAERYDTDGFYGPCDPQRGGKIPSGGLLPPDLIIQDELHLISGPLGTMAGLYETAIDELCTRAVNGKRIRPKIIASTATVRRAEKQIRALFNRQFVDIFPPPGPNRRDSFFARTLAPEESNARLYVGVAAQGRSPKVAMLRVYLALLGSAYKQYIRNKTRGDALNPADPYMTLLGYFNSLRELGGARRLIEDEVRTGVFKHGDRRRVGEAEGLFLDRTIDYEPVELTSRVETDEVARAKKRLERPAHEDDAVDVAIATNMISVGLDITRLGLMVVFGQPKTAAEYIQATSRVGRDPGRPGLVVTIFNVNKPRDRSHYERFGAYHETFYRSVEATSVTPFSPRALDKGLAGTLVGLARQGWRTMTPPLGAMEILNERGRLDEVVSVLANRAFEHNVAVDPKEMERLKERVRDRAANLLDDWAKLARTQQQGGGVRLQYNPAEAGAAVPLLHNFLAPEVKNLPPENVRMKFRANRSLRDVEPSVNIGVRTLQNQELDEELA